MASAYPGTPFDPDALQRMPKQIFRELGAAARPVTSAAPAVPAVPAAPAGPAAPAAPATPQGFIARQMARLPGFGAVARGAGRAYIAAAPVVGGVQALADSQENVARVANDTGLDYNSFWGRIGANAANFLQKTGDFASGGLAGVVADKGTRLATGQPFFDPYKGTAAPAAPATGAPSYAPTVQDLPYGPVGPADAPASDAPAPVAPFTAADVRGTRLPAPGTGAIMNSRTGAVTNLDTRLAPDVEAPEGPTYALGTVGSYVGAVMNQRQAASTQARALAARKLDVEAMGKGATAAHAAAQANQIVLQTRAAQEYLRVNPGDYAGAAAVAAGRVVQKDNFTVPFPPMSDTAPVTRLNRATGAVERVQAVQPITFAQAVASAKKNGTYKTDAQVRADMLKLPGYRLID